MELLERNWKNLSPEQLDRCAQEHISQCFAEMRTAVGLVHQRYTPIALAKDHPVATSVLAGLGGLLLSRLFFGPKSPPHAEERAPAPGKSFKSSLFGGVGGVLGKVVPELLLLWLARRMAASQATTLQDEDVARLQRHL